MKNMLYCWGSLYKNSNIQNEGYSRYIIIKRLALTEKNLKIHISQTSEGNKTFMVIGCHFRIIISLTIINAHITFIICYSRMIVIHDY